MADRIGQRVGDYRLSRSLGEGTFGDVYLGEHIYQRTPAAVKVFKAKLTPDKLKDFINEVRTALLRHPNIVQILDFGIDESDIPFLVMEFAPNGTLLQRYPRGTILPLATIIAYVKQIAAALQYAHDQRRIHRDVKPENMLFGANNEILLGDFGIAVVAHNTNSQTTEKALGTALYMAPEQWRGKPLTATDQYALGILAYEWLCGERPFRGDLYQLMYQHIHNDPPSLHNKIPTLSSEVEQVIMKALAKNPEQRFASIQAFSDALEQAYQFQQATTISPGTENLVILRHQVEKDLLLMTSERQSVHILLEILPTEMMAQVRMPLNFALVVDHSSSMRGAKLQNVKEAIKAVLDHMEPTDYISLILFDDASQILISSTPVNDPVKLKAIVDRISIRESRTAQRFMSKGMIDGLNELRRWCNPRATNRMILLTDGVTTGDGDRCYQLAREAGSEGFSIYPLGIGSDWDEDLLDNIGHLSGGMPAEFIRNPTDALSLFLEQIQYAVDITVRNATLILRLPAGVTPKKAVQVVPIMSGLGPNVLSDHQAVIPLDYLEKNLPQSVLFELIIDPRQAGLFRIGQAELNYDVPALGLVNEKIKYDITMMITADMNSQMHINAYVKNLAEKVRAHRKTTGILGDYGPW